MQEFEVIATRSLKRIGGTLPALLDSKFSQGRFYLDGKAVTIETIRAQLKRIEKWSAGQLSRLVDKLEAKTISKDEWYDQTRSIIVSAHVLAGALASGSILATVNDKDVVKRIEGELKFLKAFANEV